MPRPTPVEPAERPAPSLPARALHLFVLWSFAVAQPLFDLLGRYAEIFVAQDARPVEIVALAAVWCLVPPALVWLVELAAERAAPRLGRWLHGAAVAGLAAGFFLQVGKRLGGLPGAAWVALALGLGTAAALVYARSATLRTYLALLAPAPLVFAAAFLFFSPAARLVRPEPWTPPAALPDGVDTPVVLVVFDELSLPTLMTPDGEISERFPHFARLARGSHWFRNATTTAEATQLALPALLTGRYLGDGPPRRRLPTAASYPENLFTLLGGRYRMNVYETATNLCPRALCAPTEVDPSPAMRLRHLLTDSAVVAAHGLLPADLAARLPAVDQQWGGFLNLARKQRRRAVWREIDAKPRTFGAFLQAMRADAARHGAARSLHFLHSGLPHVPWQYLPSGTSYGASGSGLVRTDGLKKERWTKDSWTVRQGLQRYLLQLGYVDRLLGDLLDALDGSGLYEEALVIVTADHGLAFEPGRSRRRLDRHNYHDVLSVPLFVKTPHQREGATSRANVELIDVLPTIAAVLGVEVPWPVDGAPALDGGAPLRAEKRVYRAPYGAKDFLAFDPRGFDLAATAKEIARVFGPGSDPEALYRIGPRRGLLGRTLAELEVAAEARGEVRLADPGIYSGVDPASGFVPARVVGEVRCEAPAAGRLELAVAVSGVVRAVTRTVETGPGRAKFSAMVPESAFVPGDNPVRVFAVSGPPAGAPRLVPLAPDPDPGRF